MLPGSFNPDDPRQFPWRYDPTRDAVQITRLDYCDIASASFLDERMRTPREPVFLAQLAETSALGSTSPAWIFHTAFCGSTLLTRALQCPPRVLALREPRTLLDLAMAPNGPDYPHPEDARIRAERLVALLARPWQEDGVVLIKPSNQVNRILPVLLAATPRAKAIFLHSSLEQFLLSCCKKLPGAEMPLRWMAQALLPGTQLQRRLGVPVEHPFNFVEAAVLTWYAQIEIYATALAADRDDRLRSLDMRTMLEQPRRTVHAVAAWLGLPLTDAQVDTQTDAAFSRDAKDRGRAYDPTIRAQERKQIHSRYQELLGKATIWADEVVAPAAVLPEQWAPLL